MAWATNVDLPDQLRKGSPALGSRGGVLHMLHLGNDTKQISNCSYDDSHCLPNTEVFNQKS
jgi:hypothetical protein